MMTTAAGDPIVLEGGPMDGQVLHIVPRSVSLQFLDWNHGRYAVRPDGTTGLAFAAINYRDSGRIDADGRRIFAWASA